LEDSSCPSSPFSSSSWFISISYKPISRMNWFYFCKLSSSDGLVFFEELEIDVVVCSMVFIYSWLHLTVTGFKSFSDFVKLAILDLKVLHSFGW
jgi:hypothetical protein